MVAYPDKLTRSVTPFLILITKDINGQYHVLTFALHIKLYISVLLNVWGTGIMKSMKPQMSMQKIELILMLDIYV